MRCVVESVAVVPRIRWLPKHPAPPPLAATHTSTLRTKSLATSVVRLYCCVCAPQLAYSGTSFALDFTACPSMTPFPLFTVVNVNMTATAGAALPAGSIVLAQDPGSFLLAGSFSLSFSGSVWTGPMPANATNAQVETALRALPEVTNVRVTRDPAVTALTGLVLYVTVLLPVVDLPLLAINGSLLTGTGLTTYVQHPGGRCGFGGTDPNLRWEVASATVMAVHQVAVLC